MLSQIITKDIFRRYNCVGEFSFDENKFYTNFQLIQYIDGEIEIIVLEIPSLASINELSKINPYCSIEANLVDSQGFIHITDAFVNNIRFEFGNNKISYALLKVTKNITIEYVNSDNKYDSARFYMTNFINDSSQLSNQFSEFKANINNQLIVFRGYEKYSYYKQEITSNRLGVAVTAIGEVILNNDTVDIKSVDKLTYLLSYSCKTQISPICFDYVKNNIVYKTVLRQIRTTKYSHKKHLISPNAKSYFLEKCYGDFKENLTGLSLKITISIYLESLLSNYIDTSYVLLVQALEIFLASYEKWWEDKGNEIKIGSVNRIKKDINEFINSKEYSLSEEDLNELSKKLAYPYTTTLEKLSLIKKQDDFKDKLNLHKYDYDFPTIRNKIIHEGVVPKTINSSGNEREIKILEEYKRVIFMYDKIILTLLGYDGEFHDYLNENYIKF